jgi:hypothetical protein
LEDELRSGKAKAEAKLIEAEARKVSAESRLLTLRLLRNALLLAGSVFVAVQGWLDPPDLTSLQEIMRVVRR